MAWLCLRNNDESQTRIGISMCCVYIISNNGYKKSQSGIVISLDLSPLQQHLYCNQACLVVWLLDYNQDRAFAIRFLLLFYPLSPPTSSSSSSAADCTCCSTNDLNVLR